MRYIWQHIQAIIESYNGGVPLTHYLKNYYRLHPKLGSRDRKILSEMAYCWYRCEKGLDSALSFEEKIQASLALCGSSQKYIQPFLNADMKATIDLPKLFPFELKLSEGIEKGAWLASMLVQPDLFIRIRKDRERVYKLLADNNIPYCPIDEHRVALPNGAAIDKILPEDAYVTQDASSQETGAYFAPKAGETWYDCCSGAGGKSLLLKDLQPGVKLTVSDKRESILHNLKERFKQYKHTLPTAHVLDAADPKQLKIQLGTQQFDNIICDVPCSGSGTWARTPEQLYFFEPRIADDISNLQKSIAVNVAGHLKPGGRLLYITCSVFEAENEEVVSHILDNTNLKLQGKQLINGIAQKADSMFIAVLTKDRN